ncbi:glycoside hydrolase family 6 protein [Dactylosporangium vinaceum]|uniref:Glucanase n=1 Tax=Dactylosporangium vinaceum TaxID=53362 RepID=A0ABV5MN10_9ACTN|nr:glycoside hydrolase family 6 protein [Dactylosporangium vinaceum]UAB98586.1 glycoside hydrolase family 6 protein [Dactylosporangium vinaceum]
MRRLLAIAAIAAAAVVVVPSPASAASAGCTVQYTVGSQWPGGFNAGVEITNTGAALSGWSLGWDFTAGQHIDHMWQAVYTTSGRHVTASNQTFNGNVPAGGKVLFGFNGSWTGSNPVPGAFTLNGVACNGGTSTPDLHVDNPFQGAQGYVNADWSARAAAEAGGGRVANTSTAVWIERIAAVADVRRHLDAALAQATTAKPVVVQFVLRDLPARDCTKPRPDGELTAADLSRYETEFIDPIAAIQADPKYDRVRIVNVVEPDGLTDLIVGANMQSCANVLASGVYVQGTQYALNRLHRANAYNYLGAGHHAKLGWDPDFTAAVTLFADTARGSTAGVNAVDGFAVNTADYGATTEPYFTIATTVGGVSIRQSRWIDWNQYVDELTYTQALRAALIAAGFPSTIGMLVDTSRNGWGGPARPTGASTSTSVDTFVDQSRIDRRSVAGNWCNQSGAGLGERPRTSPAPGIDAYVWIKPPGESDGAATGGNLSCDSTYSGSGNGYHPTGALPGAPARGSWFSAQFQQLMTNAFPPL